MESKHTVITDVNSDEIERPDAIGYARDSALIPDEAAEDVPTDDLQSNERPQNAKYESFFGTEEAGAIL